MTEKQDTAIRREQIVQATLEVAAEQGVRAVTVKRVAERVGVSPAALYRHFRSKEAVLEAVYRHLGEHLRAHLQHALGTNDPLQGMREFLVRITALMREHRVLPALFAADVTWSEGAGSGAVMRENFAALRSGLSTLIQRAQAAGLVRAELDPGRLAVAFTGLYIPPALLSLRMPEAVDFEAQVQTNWELFERAIRPDDAGGEGS